MNILDSLWDGAISPSERKVKPGSEYDRIRKAAQPDHDLFWSSLTPEGQAAYERFWEKEALLSAISDKDFFIQGFRMGMQFLLAAITEYDTQLPQLDQ